MGIFFFVGTLFTSAVSSELPAKFDWRTKGIITSVKDQGGFGACGFFAGVDPSHPPIFEEDEPFVPSNRRDFIAEIVPGCVLSGFAS